METIKFRAFWRNKIWRVSLIDFEKETIDIVDANNPAEYYCNLHLSEVKLMQYTGLKDKNGKEIYEGDICLV